MEDAMLIADLRLYLGTSLRMLAEEAPHLVGTPWWEGAVDMAENAMEPNECPHEYVDARNQVVESGWVCLKCGSLRAGDRNNDNRML